MLKDFFKVTSKINIPSVLIGGLALPAYDVVRTTIDIDLAICVKKQAKLNKLVDLLAKNHIETKQNPKMNHDLFTIFSKRNEAEDWLKPCDAFDWDKEMLKRIKKFKENYQVLAIEDFIMTKLARADRTPVDHQDILQLLIINIDEIDWDYLHCRLDWIKMKDEFESIIDAFTLEVDSEFENKAKRILKNYKNPVKD
ncbi:MAG: hypothetical protein BAJALOKI2v1_300012 [Promethearchaeota archaeon]|nr:MAG: hypothetical protein BAJALOKI2v1_300012 [Candidatus Lokiarchaeota archaeon]